MEQTALDAAVAQARKGYDEGGLPIGAALVVDDHLVAVGHNRREQHSDSVAHAELDCLRNAGLLPASMYQQSTLYSTLSPCWMCAGAARLYQIPRVIVADAGIDAPGAEQWRATPEFFAEAGIAYQVHQHPEMIALFQQFLRERPEQWNGDVGR